MKKEYTTVTWERKNESGEVIETKEDTIVSIIADEGKKIREISTGVLCTRADITAETESNFDEVDDPNYVEVILAIKSEVSGNV